MTIDEAVAWLCGVGHQAKAQEWEKAGEKGAVITISVGEPEAREWFFVQQFIIKVRKRGNRWMIDDFGAGPLHETWFDDLEAAVQAVHEYVSRPSAVT